MDKTLLDRITTIPGLMSGRPTIRGMSFPVKDILELLASGMTHEKVIDEHPALEKEDIKAAVLCAALKMNNTVVVHAA